MPLQRHAGRVLAASLAAAAVAAPSTPAAAGGAWAPGRLAPAARVPAATAARSTPAPSAPTVVEITSPRGFDWSSAAIGAGGGIALAVIAVSGATAVGRSRAAPH